VILPGRKNRYGLLILVGLLGGLAAACGTEVNHIPGQDSRISLKLYTPPYQDAFDSVSTLRLTLMVPNGDDLVTTVDVSAEDISLSGSPASGLVLLVEGLGVDGQEILSSGQSAAFDLSADNPVEVSLLFARKGEFTRLLGDLGHARFGHSAAALADGRILVFGGAAAGDLEAPTDFVPPEVYDLATQKSCSYSDRLCPELSGYDRRFGHSVTGLPSGKAFIFGGQDEQGELIDSILIFDTQSDLFRVFSNYVAEEVHPVAFHAAELFRFDDGSGRGLRDTVIIAGGQKSSGVERIPAEYGLLYDDLSEVFTRTDLHLIEPRSKLTLTAFGANRQLVLAAGGEGAAGLVGAGELFNGQLFEAIVPSVGQGRTGLVSPRVHHAAVPVTDGVMLVGGDNLLQSIDDPEVFLSGSQFGTGFFDLSIASADANHQPRRGLIATSLPTGEVLYAGGESFDGFTRVLLNTAELLEGLNDSQAATFTDIEPLGQSLSFPSVTRLDSGALVIIGGMKPGENGPEPSAEVWYYNK